jgi:small ligand-binding sensory domain FIST
MKKLLILVLTIVTAILFYGCKKNETVAPTSSQWTFKGTAYQGIITSYDDTTSISFAHIVSVDAASNSLSVNFYSHPAGNSDYTIINNSTLTTDTDCLVQVVVNNVAYTSTGVGGGKVSVTISGGKLTATFNNIPVANGSTTLNVSGTLIQ